MAPQRISMRLVVLIVGILLILACAIWAVAVERVVPDVCSGQPPANSGPITCPPPSR